MSRPERRDTLFKSDSEIAALLGIDEETWAGNAAVLEREGLPFADPMFGGRRYWPGVVAFLDRRYASGAALKRQSTLGRARLEEEHV